MKTEKQRIGGKRPLRKDKQRNANVLGVTCGVSETQHRLPILSPGKETAAQARWKQGFSTHQPHRQPGKKSDACFQRDKTTFKGGFLRL